MKKLLLFLFAALCINIAVFAQCSINPYIQDNYELDAKLLALRAILADSSDPDFDNPFLPEERVTPYLEKLSAIYENPNNDPEIDMLFSYFNFHANQEISNPIEFKTLVFNVPTALPWVENFKNTAVSGVSPLDNLMSTYQFTIDTFIDFTSSSSTAFFIKTNYDVLNLYALIDDFEAIDNFNYAEVFLQDTGVRTNYTGQPYGIEFYEFGAPAGEYPTSACDIVYMENTFHFSVFGGDCFSGCQVGETIASITVSEDCQVLATPTFEENIFSFYPNPANNYINITSNNIQDETTIRIFDITGKQVLKQTLIESVLDVSMLHSGVYIIKINQNNKVEAQRLVIK